MIGKGFTDEQLTGAKSEIKSLMQRTHPDKQNNLINQSGNMGNINIFSRVTATDHAAVSGNTGNIGNTGI